MTFLNPFLLLGLLAAGIPILLHLLNLRRLKTIEFSTLSFLKELQKTKIRRIKIRQWLLLALRTLLVILVVLAFARPTLKGSLGGGLGQRVKTTSVFILDDSQSMTAVDDLGELLQQEKDAALRVVDLMKEGDEVYVLKLSDIGTAAMEGMKPVRNLEFLRSLLRELKPSFRHATVEDGLRVSAKLLASAPNFSREIYLFSDFQKGVITAQVSGTLVPENLFPPEVRLFLVDLGKRPSKNLGIESVAIPNSILEPNKPFTLRLRIRNEAESAVRDHVVSLFLNGERVAQKSVNIPSGSSADVDLNAVPKSAGILDGIVELENDDLEFDNRRYFSVEIPATVRVLLVGSAADLQYLKLALGELDPSSGTALRVRDVTPERLAASDLSSVDVLILSNPATFSPAQIDRLEAFLNSGGGLILFPGAQTASTLYNTGVAERLRIPPLAGIEHLQNGGSETESFLMFDRVELRHPLFQGMFEEEPAPQRPSQFRARTVESPRVKAFARFLLPPSARSVIALSNGVPFLSELQTSDRHLFVFGVAANSDWSDFPTKGLFVPLLHRSVSYLAQGASKQRDILVGAEFTHRSRSRSTERWTIVSPNQVETVVRPSWTGTESVVHFRDTDMPGLYSVKNGMSVVQKFVVNMDPEESNTQKADARDLSRLFTRLGVSDQSLHNVSSATDIQPAVLRARFGVELWKHCLLAALIVALLEMIVARENKEQRASLQPSSV